MPVQCTCLVCGSTFLRKPAKVQARNYCSRRCQIRRAIPEPLFSQDRTTARIPLMGRGNVVRGYAIVDADDAAWASQWRWGMSGSGYAIRCAYDGDWRTGARCTVLMHRELLGLLKGNSDEGDHVNMDRLDNRRENLRCVPLNGRPNMQNKTSYRGSTSQHRGVSWRASIGKWVAQVQVNGKSVYQRTFASEQEAADAAREARLRFMPYATN